MAQRNSYLTIKYIRDWVVNGTESDDKYHKQGQLLTLLFMMKIGEYTWKENLQGMVRKDNRMLRATGNHT